MKVTAGMVIVLAVATGVALFAQAQGSPPSDRFATQAGELTITFVGHGTLMLQLGSLVIHVDPVGRYAAYEKMPKADLILITHEHGDHLDASAIEKIKKEGT